MNLDKFKGKRMVHEDDKKYLEDLVYYHPDPSALWSGDNVEAGYGIDITLTPATTIAIDTDIIATKDDLLPYQAVVNSYNNHITDNIFGYSIKWSKTDPSAKLEFNSYGDFALYGKGGSLLAYTDTDEYNNDKLSFNGNILYNCGSIEFGGTGELNADTITRRLIYTDSTAHTLAFTDDIKTYTAGDNITIDANNVISATDTTYTEGTYIDIDTYHEISLNSDAEAAIDLVRDHMKHSATGLEIRADISGTGSGSGVVCADNYLDLLDNNGDSISFKDQTLDINDYDIANVNTMSFSGRNNDETLHENGSGRLLYGETGSEQTIAYLSDIPTVPSTNIRTYSLTLNSTYITGNTDTYVQVQGNIAILTCNLEFGTATPSSGYVWIATSSIKPIRDVRFVGGQQTSDKAARLIIHTNGSIELDYTYVPSGNWLTFQIIFFTND